MQKGAASGGGAGNPHRHFNRRQDLINQRASGVVPAAADFWYCIAGDGFPG
jgi:hypothetical protein